MAIRDVGDKVYVAVGNNVQEGLATLDWAIKRWSSHPISIVILHANSTTSKDLVNTPFGKLPVSSVNEEKLQVLRRCEEEKADRMLSKYTAFCGKVKAEIQKIERYDQPIQKVMLELIMELHITKLVVAISFMRPSSGRSKSAISGSFYLHRNKPDLCDVYILCGGKLLFSREDNEQEEQVEDEEQCETRLKQKPSVKGWLGKVLASGKTTPYPSSSLSSPSPSSNNIESKAQWTMYSQLIEEYFQQLLLENDDNNPVEENGSLSTNTPIHPHVHILSSAKVNEEKLEVLKMQILEAKRMTQLKKDEVKAEAERQAKASWAISLCNQRAEELEALINEEISTRLDLNKEMEDAKEQIYEAVADIQETKNRLRSLSEIQSELSNKLQVSSLAKSRAETQLENAANARTDLVRDIEELRKRRGILQRRIEFCKEKDAIGMAMACKVDDLAAAGSGCTEFTAKEIKLATDDFSEHRRLKLGGEWTNVYKGRINQNSVAIKILNLDIDLAQEVFQAKVNLLMSIRHPNIVSLIGFCPELRCLVFEYMQNGCLRDILFSRKKSSTLQWQHRVDIAAEVSSALGYLHLTQPNPITHGSLNPSNILLDTHLVAKLHTCELTPNPNPNLLSEQIDVHALGIFLLQLLCGRKWAGVNQEALMVVGKRSILNSLDENAGKWPLGLAEEIMEVAVKCMSFDSESEEDAGSVMSSAVKTLGLVKKKADGITHMSERSECERGGQLLEQDGGESSVPIIFLCPIFKGIMENPHIAADGYSYEFEAIEEWLQTAHDTSPLTKMKLEHKHLTANHTLRSLIEEWRSQNPSLCS